MKKIVFCTISTIVFILISFYSFAIDFGCKEGPMQDDNSYKCIIDTVITELNGKSVWDTTKIFKGIGIKADLKLDKEYVSKTLMPKFFSQGVIPFQMQNIHAILLHDGDPINLNFELAPVIKAEMVNREIKAKEAMLNISKIATDQAFLQKIIDNSGIIDKLNNDPKIRTELIKGANQLLSEVNKFFHR